MRRIRPPLIELRQYSIAPGRRERMIELFETSFVPAQNDLGLPILGYFRAAENPDLLVWIRGFADMESRPAMLGAFYGGPAWTEFGTEAIGYVKGYDNVQLLREATPGSGIETDLDAMPADGIVVATTYRLREAPGETFLALCAAMLHALPEGHLLGSYISDPTPNNFPALPIRDGEHLYTWFAAYPETTSPPALDETALAEFFVDAPERLVLQVGTRAAVL